MAKPIYDTTNTSTASAPVQLYSTDSAARVLAITVKARQANGNNFYFGFDSGVASTNGYELGPGKEVTIDPSDIQGMTEPATLKATSFWGNCASTADFIDWLMILEN